MKQVLVTGASGQLGAFVVSRLVGDHALSTLDIAPSNTPELPHFDASVLDPVALAGATAGMDCVVHLAALDSAVGAPERDYIEANVLGTWQVLEAAERAGVARVILCSSVAAVGIGPGMPPGYLPVDEAHPCRPRHAYGLSKQLVEATGECFARRGTLDVICLRPAFVLFPDIAVSVAAALAREDGTQWATALPVDVPPPKEMLTPTRAYVSADDAARCFAAAVRGEVVPRESFRRYFVTAPLSMPAGPAGIDTVARATALGSTTPEVVDPAHYRSEPNASMFSSARAMTELGWMATTTFDDVLGATDSNL